MNADDRPQGEVESSANGRTSSSDRAAFARYFLTRPWVWAFVVPWAVFEVFLSDHTETLNSTVSFLLTFVMLLPFVLIGKWLKTHRSAEIEAMAARRAAKRSREVH